MGTVVAVWHQLWPYVVGLATAVVTVATLYEGYRTVRKLPPRFPVLTKKIKTAAKNVLWTYNPIVNAIWALFALRHRLDRIDDRLDDLEPLTHAGLFARFIGVDHIDHADGKFHIVYSHREGAAKTCLSPPPDEYEAVRHLRDELSHSLLGGANRVADHCCNSCNTKGKKDHTTQGSFAVIGSPKHNPLCGKIMHKLADEMRARRVLWQERYLLNVADHKDEDRRTERVAYLDSDGTLDPDKLWPNLTTGREVGDRLRDYALLMKLPNFFSDRPTEHPVIVLAGCKMAGQMALTQSLSDTKLLRRLLKKYGGPTQYCSVLFTVEYTFADNRPDNVEVVAVTDSEIVYNEAAH